ncbi:MAG: sulfatase [Opitutales bacterium]
MASIRRIRSLLFAFVCLGATLASAGKDRPIIVWIFSDDHTNQAIGAYGGPLAEVNPTPNIDRLGAEGMRFDHCYVGNSICAPARATLLTGKHSHLHGKIDNRGRFDHDQQQFQKILQQHGYQTAMIGKIHLSGKMQGFDYWEVLPGQGSYYQPVFITEQGRKQYEGYVADIITEKSIDWLANKRNKEEPFMLMVHHKATHRTWKAAPRHVGFYDGVILPEPPNLFDDYANRGVAAKSQDMTLRETMHPESDLKIRTEADKAKGLAAYAKARRKTGERWAYYRMTPEQRAIWDAAYDPRNAAFFAADIERGSDAWVKWAYQRYVKDYLRSAKSIDESVGAILDYLDESGLSENTIVMYSSDQGFYLGEHGWFDKRFMYEESFRTPLLARWPGKIPAGSVNSDLVQNIDFAETFLELAEAPVPEDMQGLSLLPLLQGETPDDWRDALYYHYYEYPGTHAVRRHEGVSNGRMKLIRFYGPDVPDGEEWELFDLEKDPREMKSVYCEPAYEATVKRLKQKLDELKERYDVP